MNPQQPTKHVRLEFDTTVGKEAFNKDFNRRIREAAGVGETEGVQFFGTMAADLESGITTLDGRFVPARAYTLTFEFIRDLGSDRVEEFADDLLNDARESITENEMFHRDGAELEQR